MKRTAILCILDGFGLSPGGPMNPFTTAHIPHIKSLFRSYPWTTLNADGASVGQEQGLVGNSEVGHMNIGGMQLVPQLSWEITASSANKFVYNESNPGSQKYDPYSLLVEGQTVHIMGLFSEASIHSDLRHWARAIEASHRAGAGKIVLHIFSDGRDSDTKSLIPTWNMFVEEYGEIISPAQTKIELGSLGGRFWGMDRDTNIERTQRAFDAIIEDSSPTKWDDIANTLQQAAQTSYNSDILDEELAPVSLGSGIHEGDAVWMVNFRTDRSRQIMTMMCEQLPPTVLKIGMNDYGISEEISRTEYTKGAQGYVPLFQTHSLHGTLAGIISRQGKTQLHIAETEKYAHVTFFLNGGKEVKHEGEDWQIIPSNKITSHADKPEMKAKEVTDHIIQEGLGKYDYIIVNYANPDMVGHTGDYSACVKTLEVLDNQLGRLHAAIQEGGHSMIITADHGNIEEVGEYTEHDHTMTDTRHNANPVPCLVVSSTKLDYDHIARRLTHYNHDIDTDFFLASLKHPHRLDLSTNWMRSDQIPPHNFPLWYLGPLLLSL